MQSSPEPRKYSYGLAATLHLSVGKHFCQSYQREWRLVCTRAGVPVAWAAAARELLAWLCDHAAGAAIPEHLASLPGSGLRTLGPAPVDKERRSTTGDAGGRRPYERPALGNQAEPASAPDPGEGSSPGFTHARAAARFLARLALRLPRLCELALGPGVPEELHDRATDPSSEALAQPGAEAAAELVGLVGLCGPEGAGAASLESLFRLACAPDQAQAQSASALARLRAQGAVLVSGAGSCFDSSPATAAGNHERSHI